MTYTEAADGSLTISDDASNPVDDLQKIADLAVKLGGLIKVTSSQRTQLTGSQVRVGWLISETNTGRLYLSTTAKPQGELVHTPETVAYLAFAGIYSSSPDAPAALRSKNGRASLEGIAVSTSDTFLAGPTYLLGDIPEGYRPGKDEVFAVPAFSTILARLLVRPDGKVYFQVSANFNGQLSMGLAGASWKVSA